MCCWAIHLILGLSLSLLPYFLCVRGGGLNKSAHMLSFHLSAEAFRAVLLVYYVL